MYAFYISMISKAVYLEIVSDLKSDAFVATLKTFLTDEVIHEQY